MCRGCVIKLVDGLSKDAPHILFLDMIDAYQAAIALLKGVETAIQNYERLIDNREQKKLVGKFRREILKHRRAIGKADTIISTDKLQMALEGKVTTNNDPPLQQ